MCAAAALVSVRPMTTVDRRRGIDAGGIDAGGIDGGVRARAARHDHTARAGARGGGAGAGPSCVRSCWSAAWRCELPTSGVSTRCAPRRRHPRADPGPQKIEGTRQFPTATRTTWRWSSS